MARRPAWIVEQERAAEARHVQSHDAMSNSKIGHANGETFVESLGEPPKRKARSSKKRLADAIDDLFRVFPAGRILDGFAERHLVALYARLHEQVYGAAPAELAQGKEFLAACSSAAKLVREEFRGEQAGAIEFLRWTWRRERFAETKRRADGTSTGVTISGRRIGWRLQFASRSIYTDYKVDLARQGEQGPARKERR